MASRAAHSIIKTMEQLPVLLVHGFASSAEHGWREPGWVDLISEGGRDVIAVDLLGSARGPCRPPRRGAPRVPALVLLRHGRLGDPCGSDCRRCRYNHFLYI